MEMVADWPLHMVDVPLMAAVGRGLTVIIALPLRSEGCAAPLVSLRVVIVYVLSVTGETVKLYGLATIPFTVTGVIPSV